MQKRKVRAIRPRVNGNSFSRQQAIKLSVCAGVFLSLMLIKLFDPAGSEQLSVTVNAYIGDQTPTTMQTIGRAITDGDNIIDVFKNLSAVLTGAVRVDNEDEAGTLPGALPPNPQENNGTMQHPDDTSAAKTPDSADGLSKHPPSADSTLFSKGGEIDVIPVVFEGELISGGGFGIDDTLPLPFGYDAPPNVDFTIHTFGFEHTPPLYGTVTSRFGYRTHPVQGEPMFHYGVDIAANTGTEIRSFAAGIVTNTGKSKSYGNYILITHKDGVSSFYAHCSKILAKRGAKVEMGQVIALAGSTGTSTGPHLHFELRLDGKIIDPEFYIRSDE